MWTKDFKEFVELLEKHNVEYLIVGGYALGVHGYPRYTGDLDIWINPTKPNAEKIIAVLGDFGFGSLGLIPEDFSKNDNIIQLGHPPIRIDIITSPDGVVFEDCYKNRLIVVYDNLHLSVIGLQDLKKNKGASGRPRDLEDLRHLQ